MSNFIIFVFFAILATPSFSGFLAPITKHHHHSAPFYTISVYLKTPLQPTNLLLDLGATFTTIDCTRNYTSTTSRSIPCNSPLCLSLRFPHGINTTNCDIRGGNSVVPGGRCILFPQNSFAVMDLLALPTTNGRNPGQLGLIPGFVFSCSNTTSYFLRGHGKKELTGLAGLGYSKFSIPAQLSTGPASMGLFALCLSGSPSAPGVAFFGHAGPYYFMPETDISNYLNYTPIISSIKNNGKRYHQRVADEYFIGVTSIKINGKTIRLNRQLLTVDPKGYGGTRISTINPYTVLERSIYKAFVEAFVNESASMKLKVAETVKPFGVCYQADDIPETHLGPNVPTVDLVLQSDDVFWRIFGRNSMVRIVREGLDVWCLGFMDGGVRPRSSVVIGGHQIEDNLLQFDVGRNRLGFSSSLLLHSTMCANFNFTTNTTIKIL